MVIILVSALSFIGLGMLVSIVPLMTPERGTQVLHIVEAVLMLVSGIYYEVDILPAWMQTLAQFSPATYALGGMRKSLIENATVSALWSSHIVPLLIMGLIFIPLGTVVFGFAEQRAKKRGLLKRSG
jgi:ABC-2 type transport system permease protein